MFRLQPRNIVLGALAVAVLVSAAPASAAVVYREIFPNDTGADAAASTVGWKLNWGDTGAEGTSLSNYVVSGGDGQPTDLAPVNSGTSDERVRGYLVRLGTDGGKHLYWTEEYNTLNLATTPVQSISWWQYNGHSTSGAGATDEIRVALRVGTSWYVSVETFTNVAKTWTQNTLTIDEDTAWYALSFTKDETLAMVTTQQLQLPTSGVLTAFGLYADSKTAGNGRFHRFDAYTIEAVPEPAMLGLASVAGLLMLRRRRA